MKNNHFYLTTTLPYINANPHIGHAMEFIQADARFRFEQTREDAPQHLFFNTGTDEHGTKIYQSAKNKGQETQVFADEMSEQFKKLVRDIGMCPTKFIRTTDAEHKKAVEHIWDLCYKNGDIYKKEHTGYYCVGCELFIAEEDLVDGECPLHPGKKVEQISEENYFFRLSKYRDQLLEMYKNNEIELIPEVRKSELIALLEGGLHDISISRSSERLTWGIPVPNDDTQVIYVWFDALTNYISTLGWPTDEKWSNYWPMSQIAGKDNLRQQAVIWQAMLLSAGLKPSKQIYIHGFLTSQGKKMSKTVGNVIDPYEIINTYSASFLRIFLLLHIHPYEDSDITMEKIAESYTADCVNGLGNLTSRILTMSSKHIEPVACSPTYDKEYIDFFEAFNIQGATQHVWEKIRNVDKRITEREPFKLIKADPEKGKVEITELVQSLASIAHHLAPITPDIAETIQTAIRQNTPPEQLFPRLT